MHLELNKDQLLEHLLTYFTDEVEACPLNAEAFCDTLLAKYGEEEKENEPDSEYLARWDGDVPLNFPAWQQQYRAKIKSIEKGQPPSLNNDELHKNLEEKERPSSVAVKFSGPKLRRIDDIPFPQRRDSLGSDATVERDYFF